ncbi:hypothetical protein [Saccharicrinis aurantiacus]|uniref:hypothetical protein n=1 Tax=Saccharicrinis aurantiacus TaxID=1849719 RepID=UPI0008390A93|nr:hypothetical protein [Saccharicrinis aurantiacus]
MRRILASLVLATLFMVSFAQSPAEKKSEYFIKAAVEEFDLDKKQKKTLTKERSEYVSELQAIYKAKKNGDLNQEEFKPKLNKINADFKQTMCEITGKTNAELKPFFTRMQKEMKDIK